MFESLTPHGVIAAALLAPPGADVVAALDRIDPLALDPDVRVDLMVAWERQLCWVTARGIPVIAAVGEAAQQAAEPWNDERELTEIGLRSAHAEIGAAPSARNTPTPPKTTATPTPAHHPSEPPSF